MRFTNQNITSLLVLASMLFIFSCGKENDIVPEEEPTVKSTTTVPTTEPTTVPTTPTPPIIPPPTTESESLMKSF